jgi:hypothetical protein
MRHITDDHEPVIEEMADIEEKPLLWLVPWRVPMGTLTTIMGEPGVGKSSVALDFAARVSRGDAMPDGSRGELYGKPSGVVLLSCEDDPGTTIKPKLRAMGADLSHIALIRDVTDSDDGERRLVHLEDFHSILKAIKQKRARLLVIDPLTAYMPRGKNVNSDQDVRSVFAPWMRYAADNDFAIIIVRHPNKLGSGTNINVSSLHRGGGSIGVVGAARSELAIARALTDEDGKLKVLAQNKHNLCEEGLPGWLFRTVKANGKPPIVVWEGETHQSLNEMMRPEALGDESEGRREVMAWLQERLKDGPVDAKIIKEEAKAAGYKARTLERAKGAIGARSRKGDGAFHDTWVWLIPAKIAKPAQDCQPDHAKAMPSSKYRGMVSHFDVVGNVG